jgi:hypothetical protein
MVLDQVDVVRTDTADHLFPASDIRQPQRIVHQQLALDEGAAPVGDQLVPKREHGVELSAVTNARVTAGSDEASIVVQRRAAQSRASRGLGQPDFVFADHPLARMHRPDRSPECRKLRTGQRARAEHQEVAL